YTAQKMCYMMKVVEKMLDWENAGKIDLLKPNYPLRAPELLFRKIEDKEVTEQIQKLKTKSQKMQEAAKEKLSTQTAINNKPIIQFDDFAKMDLQVGTILEAEKVEKTDKLMKLKVDIGYEQRTIV